MDRMYSPAPSIIQCDFLSADKWSKLDVEYYGVNRPISSTADSVVRWSQPSGHGAVLSLFSVPEQTVCVVLRRPREMCAVNRIAHRYLVDVLGDLSICICLLLIDTDVAMQNYLPIDRSAVRAGYLWSQHSGFFCWIKRRHMQLQSLFYATCRSDSLHYFDHQC